MKAATEGPNRFVRAIGRPARLANTLTKATPAAARRAISRLCWGIVFVFIAWDLYLMKDGIPDNTWSEVMRSAGGRYPVVPWLLGLLLGHLFHPQDNPEPLVDREAAGTVLVVLTLALVLLGSASAAWPLWWAGALALAGFIVGQVLWPMGRKTKDWQW